MTRTRLGWEKPATTWHALMQTASTSEAAAMRSNRVMVNALFRSTFLVTGVTDIRLPGMARMCQRAASILAAWRC